MASAIMRLPARDPGSGLLNAVIESPKGSRNTTQPQKHGSSDSTSTSSGSPSSARVEGMKPKSNGNDERGKTVRNDRLVAVLETAYNPPRFKSLVEVPSHVLAEIEQFFVDYNRSEGREFKPSGRHGPERAEALLEAAGKS
jgi:inorganic pyrophosphatase